LRTGRCDGALLADNAKIADPQAGPSPWYSTSRFSAPRYLALDGTDHAGRHGRRDMIRRPIIWRPQSRSAPAATPPPGPGRRLTRHWPAVPGHARQAARRSSLERTAAAIASSRNVRTGKARQPGLPDLLGTPRRPRARTDHTSHSSSATCRSVAGSRPSQLHHIDCAPRQSALPARPLTRPPGTTARPRAGLRRRSHHRAWAT
jgi:hypothetical protein